MTLPKINLQSFLTFPVMLVAGLGAIGTVMQWSGHSVVSRDDVHAAQIAQNDSVQREILAVLQRIEANQADDGLLQEAQIRGECLENDLPTIARQGLLNACQERNLLLGRTITPSVAAAAVEASPLATPTASPDSLP